MAAVITVSQIPVRADAVYEPSDAFYSKHYRECEEEFRNYLGNGEKGYVPVYKSPDKHREINRIPNGSRILITCTYVAEDGQVWGYCDGWLEVADEFISGWVRMADFTEIYDDTAFQEEYDSELIWEYRTLDADYMGTNFYFWEYPGAEEPNWEESLDWELECRPIFVDEFGYVWGRCGYYYGMEGWICMDAPHASYEELYPGQKPKRGFDKKQTEEIEETEESDESGNQSYEETPREEEASVTKAPSHTTQPASAQDKDDTVSAIAVLLPIGLGVSGIVMIAVGLILLLGKKKN